MGKRTNKCPNPAAKNNSTGWSLPPGWARSASVTTLPRTTGIKGTSAPSNDIISPVHAVTAAQQYCVSFSIHYTNVSGTNNYDYGIDWYNSSGSYLSSTTYSHRASAAFGITERLEHGPQTAPTGATGAVLVVSGLDSGAEITAVLFENTSTTGRAYFDGDSTSPKATWTGTAGNSTSLELTAADAWGWSDTAVKSAVAGPFGADVFGWSDSVSITGTTTAAEQWAFRDTAMVISLGYDERKGRVRVNAFGLDGEATRAVVNSRPHGSGKWSPVRGGKVAINSAQGTSVDVELYRRGINTAGGEFAASSTTLPGVYGTDYAYDTAGAFLSLAARGHKVIRLPFRWERIQPTRAAPLDSAELARLRGVVSDIRNAGMTCILDVHNYARYIPAGGAEQVLGDGSLTQEHLVDLWTRLSTAFQSDPGIYAYGLMNEPHDLPALAGAFTGTVRYDWNGGTVAGWTGDTATASSVATKLRLTASTGAGSPNMRKDDAGAVAGGTGPTGPVIRFECTLVADPGATGAWTAKAQWQNSSFVWQNPTSVAYTRIDNGATVTGLIVGVPVYVTCTFSSITSPPNAFAIQVDGHGATAGTLTVDIDNFAQGTLAGGLTGVQAWEAASQACVTAIRGNNDTTKIMVPGYGFSGAQVWATNHPTPWITDPSGNVAYEAHYYFDTGNSGVYSSGYGTENAAAITAGYASLSARAVAELGVFTSWVTSHGCEGFVGEMGWPTSGTPQSFTTIGATTSGQVSAVAAAGMTHNVVVAFWDRLQPSGAGTALDTAALAELNATITANTAAGMKSILEHALHYPPAWVRSAVEPFKDQAGNVWTGSTGAGDQVRNWYWTALGRTYVADFLTKVRAGITPTNRLAIDRIRFGGGVFGELHYPTTAVASPFSYWAYGTSMQTGAGLATGLTSAPNPGYTPFTGTTTQDDNFIAWYIGGVNNWLTWCSTQLATVGWTCDLMCLHPGYGIRSNQVHSDAGYRQALSCGEDPASAIATYASNPQVWPWCTWINGPDGFTTATVDSDQAAWKKVFAEAYKWNKHTRIWGENTGGESNSGMDSIFVNALAQGVTPAIGNPLYPSGVTPPASFPGYVGMMWLNYADLTAGGSHATLAHYQLKVGASPGSWNDPGSACYSLLDAAQIDATYWSAGARWGTGYPLSAYTGTNQDVARSQANVIEAHPSARTTITTPGSGTFARTVDDYEFPAGMAVDYQIVIYANAEAAPDAIVGQAYATLPAIEPEVWLKFVAKPALNRRLTLTGWDRLGRQGQNATFRVRGRRDPIVVTDVHTSRTTTISLRTESIQDGDALDEALSAGYPAFLHTPVSLALPTMYVAIGDWSYERPSSYSHARSWTIDLTEIAPPPPSVFGPPTTWADIIAAYPTWRDLMDAFPTWRDVMGA